MNDVANREWDIFGRPLIHDPSTRRLSRVGVVDVGSNSVRMVVFDGAARSPAYFYNEKVMAGLGAGLTQTGRLNPEGKQRALSALRRFQALAQGMGITPLHAVATAAMRDAEDGPAFRAEIEAATGMEIHVIDGEEEARLSAQGVLLGWPEAKGLICDIGGSSMELAEIGEGTVGRRLTSGLGPLKLSGLGNNAKARAAHIKDVMAGLKAQLDPQYDRLFLVGGSWRAIARIDMERRGYPLHVLHEYRMSARDIRETIKFIQKADLEALRQTCSLSSARMALVPLATEVLGTLVRAFAPREIALSSYGIREGLLFEQMPQRLRDRDPLIEACRFAEHKDARVPGFGKVLYRFIEPLFRGARPDRKRIIQAACLLHDVSWRAHPDYRAEVTFDNATRANLGGLKHSERVFLGLALLHRYKNSRAGSPYVDLFKLLEEKDLHEAEVVGKAMRFGAMMWLAEHGAPGTLEWHPKKKTLTLNLAERAEPLFGEVAQARFRSLASALGSQDTKVTIHRDQGPPRPGATATRG